jgi:uncharacterized membrane protein YdfJ with MMPL/SSD domain
MQNELAILACGSAFDGTDAMLLMSAFLSLVLSVLLGITNLVMILVLENRRQPIYWHLMAWLGYLIAGVAIFTGALKDLTLICVAVMGAATIISIHLAFLIELLRRTRRSS